MILNNYDMKTITQKVLNFLKARNPLDIPQDEYDMLLMSYIDTQGEEALQALAGFYIFALDKLKGDKQTHAIKSTFNHDLFGQFDELMLPRSSNYANFWKQN